MSTKSQVPKAKVNPNTGTKLASTPAVPNPNAVKIGKGKSVGVAIPNGSKAKLDPKLADQAAKVKALKAAGAKAVEGCHDCPPPPCPDECPENFRDCAGVCGGNAVLDCNGYCCGGTTHQECAVADCFGICGGDNVRDCNGVCNGNAIHDCTGHCCGGNTGKECAVRDCAGVCNGHAVPDCDGVCGGNKVKDCAGVCGGDAVPDCFGVCNGNAVPDCAGVCNGPNRLDCAGVCGGCAVPDCFGVCNGHATYDCDGVCGGSHEIDCSGECCDPFDQYDGPSCQYRDCMGVCGGCAAPDCAGVCNGDHFRDCAGKCMSPCDEPPSNEINGQQTAQGPAVVVDVPKVAKPSTAGIKVDLSLPAKKTEPKKTIIEKKEANKAIMNPVRGAPIKDERARAALPADIKKETEKSKTSFRYK